MTSPLQPPSPPPPVQAPVKKGLIAEFREFINKGNVIDLAVAVVLGAAFTNVVNSVVNGVLNPLLAAVVGKASFEDFGFDIGDSRISIGTVIDAAITFALTALVLFFIVKAYNRMREKAEETPAGPTDIQILTEIRDELRRRPA